MSVIRNVANGILGLVGLKIADGQTPKSAPEALTSQYAKEALELSRSPRHRARVNEYLRRAGLKIEEGRNKDIPLWSPDQFDRDVSTTENAYSRRMTGKTIVTNSSYLRDGGVFKPED